MRTDTEGPPLYTAISLMFLMLTTAALQSFKCDFYLWGVTLKKWSPESHTSSYIKKESLHWKSNGWIKNMMRWWLAILCMHDEGINRDHLEIIGKKALSSQLPRRRNRLVYVILDKNAENTEKTKAKRELKWLCAKYSIFLRCFSFNNTDSVTSWK